MASVKTKVTRGSKANSKKQGRGKSEPELTIPDAWINELADLEINDDEWRCSIIMIEETSTEASIYLDQFNKAAINGNRLAVKAISQTEAVEFVKKTILKEQNKRASPLDLLCKEIYSAVGPDFEKMIPTSLLANLLKYIILEYKALNKHIRMDIMNKNKELEDYRQSLWPPFNAKSASAKSNKTGVKSVMSSKSGAKPSKTKIFTNLRKRGEEWKDRTWIDDAPDSGPQLYVTISNFYDPSLPLELLKLNMPLDAIVELDIFHNNMKYNKNSSNETRSSNFRKRSRPVRDKTFMEKKKIKISKFWSEIDFLKDTLPTSLMFKNVMFLRLVPDRCESLDGSDSFQTQIYTQISHFMFDIFENSKLHKTYLGALDITDVTDDREQESPDLLVYNSILDNLPHESLTIAFILDAILAEVCSLEVDKRSQENKETEVSHSVNDKLDSISKHLQKLNQEYDVLQDYDIAYGSEFVNLIQPSKNITTPIKYVLIHSDEVSIKTFHLKKDIENFIKSRTKHVLKSAWENFWTNYFIKHDTDNNFIRLCNIIIKSENKCDQKVLYYYMYIMIVNCILNSILMSSDFVPPEHIAQPTIIDTLKEDLCDSCLHEINSAIPLLNSFHKLSLTGQVPEPSEDSYYQASSYSLTSEIIANSLFYIEDMPSDILIQNLQMEFSKFNHFETRYCPFTEQLVIVLHNLFSVGDSWEETWIGKLTTIIPPRDFVEYTVEEEYSWLNNYIDQSPDQSLDQGKTNCLPANELTIPATFLLPDSNFLSHNSLKYKQSKKEQVISPKSTRSKGSSIPLTTYGSGSKINPENIDISGQDETDIKEESFSNKKENKHFIGYELGEPQRYQFTGTVKEKLFEDQTKISIQKVEKLYGEESQTLNVTVNGNSLYYAYKPSTASSKPFHVMLSSGTILHFGNNYESNNIFKKSSTSLKKESTSEPLIELNENFDNNSQISEMSGLKTLEESVGLCSHIKSYLDSKKFPHEIREANFHKIPLVYDFKMSTPSGLHVELVQAQNRDLLYVRQELLSKGCKSETIQQEKLRCYSSSGYIIKFMVGGEIEILGGSGAVYLLEQMKDKRYSDMSSERIKTELEEKDKLSLRDKIKKLQRKSSKKRSGKKQSEAISKMSEKVLSNDSERSVTSLDHELRAESHLNIEDYKYTTSDGRQFVVNKGVAERIEDILTMTSIDITNNCFNGERLDGVTSTYNADGSLIVRFPDGSCITSTPVEAEEVFCEWSTSEYDLWFSNVESFSNQRSHSTKGSVSNSEVSDLSSHKNSSSKPREEDLTLEPSKSIILNQTSERSLHSELNKNSITSMSVHTDNQSFGRTSIKTMRNSKIAFSTDGFVVYTLNFFMEHPHYSSVYYDCDKLEVELQLPFSTSISLKSDGSYKVLLEGVDIIVQSDKVHLSMVNENHNSTRTIVVNTKGTDSAKELKSEEDVRNCFDESAIKLMSLEMQKKLLNCQNIHSYLLYTVNELGNQMFIDFDFNIREVLEPMAWSGIQGNEFSCFVINKDLSGFRMINGSEIDQYIQFVQENHGLVRRSEDIWSSLLTSLPVLKNESQKWVMERSDSTTKADIKSNISTFGRRESWTKPFVSEDTNKSSFTESEVMIARILHRIPTEGKVLSELRKALEAFKTYSKSSEPIKVNVDPKKGDLNLTEMKKDPTVLQQIYKEEREKVRKEHDKFRSDMKNTFLHSLIRQACIKARKIRQQNKVEEFKYILRTKHIPPYHLSCFGQVHEILDEVLENVNVLRKTPSSFARVASVIDEILNLVVTGSAKNDNEYEVTKTSDNEAIEEIVEGIFENFCDLSKQKSYQNLISLILSKPLDLVTPDEIDILCQSFQSGAGDCPILYDEEFILEDILEARHQLSHYFRNLKEMLEYYRDIFLHDDKIRSVSFYTGN